MSLIVKRERFSPCSDTINLALESFNRHTLNICRLRDLERFNYESFYPFFNNVLKLESVTPLADVKNLREVKNESSKICSLNIDQIKEFIPLQKNASKISIKQKSELAKDTTPVNLEKIGPVQNIDFKYPLEFNWSFWFFKNSKSQEWEENLILLTTVSYVEEFWSVYHYLKHIECLSDGCDYMLFKQGIRPCWEDKQNVNGGRWVACVNKSQSLSLLSDLWRNSLMTLIGSSYDNDISFINGIVISIRHKTNKISLWIKQVDDNIRDGIGKSFVRLLDIKMPLVYDKHDFVDNK
jgi:translation initiation factor 4E